MANPVVDIFKNIDKYKTNKEHKILIVFDDMIADILGYKNFQGILQLNIFLVLLYNLILLYHNMLN